jgi:hypothetical protein
MVAFVVGFLVALIFLGLPLGIIGLFILSIIDQISPEMRNTPQDGPASDNQGASKHRFGYSRQIVGTNTL